MIEDVLSGTACVRTARRGHLGCIILDKPKRLNAVDLEMATGIERALTAWRDDPSVQAVLIESSAPRAFCAGGDLKAIRDVLQANGPDVAFDLMNRVYQTMLHIAQYAKPVVSFMDGIAMGGGVGLGGHARYRVVTERSIVAMPETSIGLVPDAGGSWLLARAPGGAGLRLALTGGRMSGVEAVAMGFADHLVPSDSLDDLRGLLALRPVEDVFGLIAPLSLPEHACALEEYDPSASLEQIVRGLESSDQTVAKADFLDISRACPTSIFAAWYGWQLARRAGSLEEAFAIEGRLVRYMLQRSDFAEGVRARLIDRDNAPLWQPAILAAVDVAALEAILAA
ncbi:enoyl-CoA hydratase/isomerase family protein [Acetobacter lambici]|uniref:3-hydroxyisobutyryl-CoA hydrolase n=1 Tax=Acetobacter lambici TaxID=1332824 RepID=A0ABT1F5Y7_9PROT|nr:enoyl-CoA hydratase/isomerase family protein [Acetobacter lambici]MCP1242976.1 enoyl-CoA hydratase/isomerase family protein [Acetobacter lambici]MCP1259154.1 enoyl-CoA hydratase/isomerase family protein [Acetobacter lambici]NHO57352.1 enoyl-CoA hydratase/isomerase family protein [Acetobacter lambici]